MASLSEHFEAIKAAIEAAKEDGHILFVDNMEMDYDDRKQPALNLWDEISHDQLDFPLDLWRWN